MIPAALQRLVDDLRLGPEAPLVSGLGPGEARIDGRAMINMASNDYLGFARDPRILAAAHDALDKWGLGSAAGRVLAGNTTLHRDLEQKLARWVGSADAAPFSSCWTANGAIIAALAELASGASIPLAVFSDTDNHASIIDAIRAQRPAISHLGLFNHDDGQETDLAHQLAAQSASALKVIITDGVFSMEGDQAPLARLTDMAQGAGAIGLDRSPIGRRWSRPEFDPQVDTEGTGMGAPNVTSDGLWK